MFGRPFHEWGDFAEELSSTLPFLLFYGRFNSDIKLILIPEVRTKM